MKDDITQAFEDDRGYTKETFSAVHASTLMDTPSGLRGSYRAENGDDYATMLVDALTDLQHFACDVGVDFDTALSTARMHHDAECEA